MYNNYMLGEGLNSDDRKRVDKDYCDLEKFFTITIKDGIDFIPQNFALFNHYISIGFRRSITLNAKDNVRIAFIELTYFSSGGRSGYGNFTEIQVWASLHLPKDFGHIIIRPETFRDMIIEFFEPLEMDFPDDETFSKKYYILSKDVSKAQNLLRNERFRREFINLNTQSFQMEILNDTLILSNNKKSGSPGIVALATFVNNVSGISF